MTSLTLRLQRRIDDRPAPTAPEIRPIAAQRLLAITAALSIVVLIAAVIGLVVDPRTIGGEAAWVKPAKFGFSIALNALTLRWIAGAVPGRRRLLAVLAAVLMTAFGLETAWIVVQVVRGTRSHFNTATALDAAAFNGAGAVVSTIFLATLVLAGLALRTPGLDAGIGAGVRWGLVVCLLGMAEAVSMLLNGTTATTTGAHTVGAPDGGPGLPLVGWSALHGDLRVGHFIGLHALQALPLLAWALSRTRLGVRVRVDLVRIAGVGAAAAVVLVWWQAERGQALLRPDALSLAALGVLVTGAAAAAGAALLRDRAAAA